MDDQIRFRALRATAKVALSLTVVGCGGVAEVPGERAEPELGADPPTYAKAETTERAEKFSARPLEAEPEEIACGAPGEVADVVADAEQLSCCTSLIEPLAPGESNSFDDWLEASADPDVQGCCAVVVANVNEDFSLLHADVDQEVFWGCCEALHFPKGACTPWGPPVPRAVAELPLLPSGLEVA